LAVIQDEPAGLICSGMDENRIESLLLVLVEREKGSA
jgi:hypothetical protein